jgi:hypothetical protein
MLTLIVKEHPMFLFIVGDSSVVATRSVLDETHSVSHHCSFRGCKAVFCATPFERIGMNGWCSNREFTCFILLSMYIFF